MSKSLMRGAIMPHYVDCAMWSSSDEDGAPLDDSHGPDDVAADTLQVMRDECAAFFFANRRTMREASGTHRLLYISRFDRDMGRYSPAAQHAHDYWLTRNGHGAGFWDRGYGAAGEALSDAAQADGGCDLYVGDDGLVYG